MMTVWRLIFCYLVAFIVLHNALCAVSETNKKEDNSKEKSQGSKIGEESGEVEIQRARRPGGGAGRHAVAYEDYYIDETTTGGTLVTTGTTATTGTTEVTPGWSGRRRQGRNGEGKPRRQRWKMNEIAGSGNRTKGYSRRIRKYYKNVERGDNGNKYVEMHVEFSKAGGKKEHPNGLREEDTLRGSKDVSQWSSKTGEPKPIKSDKPKPSKINELESNKTEEPTPTKTSKPEPSTHNENMKPATSEANENIRDLEMKKRRDKGSRGTRNPASADKNGPNGADRMDANGEADPMAHTGGTATTGTTEETVTTTTEVTGGTTGGTTEGTTGDYMYGGAELNELRETKSLNSKTPDSSDRGSSKDLSFRGSKRGGRSPCGQNRDGTGGASSRCDDDDEEESCRFLCKVSGVPNAIFSGMKTAATMAMSRVKNLVISGGVRASGRNGEWRISPCSSHSCHTRGPSSSRGYGIRSE